MVELGNATCSSAAAPTGFLKVVVFAGLVGLAVAISVFNPYWGVSALALLLASVVFGMNLKWGLLSLLFLLPFDPQLEIRTGAFLYFDLLFVLPALVYSWKVLFGNLRVNWAALALVPYVLFAIASTFWRTENLFWFAGYSVRLIIAVLFMAVIAGIGRAETITSMLGASLVPQVFYGVYQLLAGNTGSLYSLVYPHYQNQPWTDRAYGFFFQPNNFGSYCATISIMLLALGLRSKAHRSRILCWVLAAFGFVGVASSGSRGSWFGALAGLALLLVFSRASFSAKVTLAMATSVSILVAKSLEYAPLMRAESIDTFTIEGRLTMYLAAFLLFLQHPLIGVGLTNYQELMPSVVAWEYGTGNAAHNTYLQILSENGIIGFLLFFGPIFYFFYRNLKRAKKSTAALLSSVGLTVFLVHGLFDFQFTTAPQYLLLFAVLFGLASKCVLAPGTFYDAQRIDLAQSGTDTLYFQGS